MASTSSLALSQALLARAISLHGSDQRISLPSSFSRASASSRRRNAASMTKLRSIRPLVRAAAVETLETSTDSSIIDKSVNSIRFLAIDAVEKAKSGHPGLPMGCAPMAHILYDEVMRYNPKNPYWFNRDRFVLSAGHGCMLLYALLHLAGYDSVLVSDLKDSFFFIVISIKELTLLIKCWTLLIRRRIWRVSDSGEARHLDILRTSRLLGLKSLLVWDFSFSLACGFCEMNKLLCIWLLCRSTWTRDCECCWFSSCWEAFSC